MNRPDWIIGLVIMLLVLIAALVGTAGAQTPEDHLDRAMAEIEAAKALIAEEPEPEGPPVPVYLYAEGLDRVPLASFDAGTAGSFNLCLDSADGVSAPVRFTWPGGGRTENVSLYCAAGSDDGSARLSLAPGAHAVEISHSGLDPFTITVTVAEPESSPPEHPAPEPPSEAGLPHAQPVATFPNIEDGRPVMQHGLCFLAYWESCDPFVDKTKTMNGWTWREDWPSRAEIALPDLIAQGYVDPETLYPVGSPPGEGRYDLGLFLAATRQIPPDLWPAYRQSGRFIAEWDGQAMVQCGLNCTTESLGPNKALLKVGESHNWARLSVKNPGPDFANLRVYREEDADLAAAGRVYTDQFVDYHARYKVLRTMDLQSANTTQQRLASDEFPFSAPFWSSERRGVPFKALFALASETGSALHLHAPPYLGAPETLYAHYEARTTREIGPSIANEIVESAEWDKWADALVSELIASGYPSDRLLLVELGNEIWNFAAAFNRATNYFWGLGDGLDSVEGFRGAYGYVSARLALAIEEALARQEREQAWRIVIAGHTAWDARTRTALEGYGAYFRERNIDPTRWYSIAGVAVTSYYSSNFQPGRFMSGENAETQRLAAEIKLLEDQPQSAERDAALKDLRAQLNAERHAENKRQWLDQIATRPEDLAKEYADWLINSDERFAIPHVAMLHRQHAAIAAEFGADFVQNYEGGSHDNAPKYLNDEPTFANWVEWFRFESEHGTRVTQAWIETLFAQRPNGIIANYGSVHPVTPGDGKITAPWYDGWYGQENSRTKALDKYLRP